MGFMSDNADKYIIGNQVDEDNNVKFKLIWNSEEHYEDISLDEKIVVEGIDVYDGYFRKEILAKDLSTFEDKDEKIVELFGDNKLFKVLYYDSELIFRFDGGRLDWEEKL
jgi:hypothetical protein